MTLNNHDSSDAHVTDIETWLKKPHLHLHALHGKLWENNVSLLKICKKLVFSSKASLNISDAEYAIIYDDIQYM